MAALVYGTSFNVPSAVTASSEQAAFPGTNAKLLRYPRRSWKTDGVIENATLAYDWGTATGMTAVVLDDVNFVTVKIQADSASTFNTAAGLPEYDSGNQTISQDGRDGRYKLFFVFTQTYRYVRIKIISTTTTDSSSSARVGSFGVLNVYSTWGGNFGFPLEWSARKPVMGVGTSEPLAVGGRYTQLVLNSTHYSNSLSMEATLNTMMGLGEDTLFCLYLNKANTSEVYLCDRVGSVSLSTAGPNTTRFTQMAFREVGELIGG